MADEFQAFFSYAHADAKVDPDLFEDWSTQLAERVSGMLVNARLNVWRDTDKLTTGDQWNARIETALNGSHLLIVMLSPNWLESTYCRKEHRVFSDIEPPPKEFVIPLLVEHVADERDHLDSEQAGALDALLARQYQPALAEDYLAMSEKQVRTLILAVARHVKGKIEVIRKQAKTGGSEAAPVSKAYDISRIASYAPNALIGRASETKAIDDAWTVAARGDAERPRILAFVAQGGEGKTALVADWATHRADEGWRDCEAAFAWSFYSQGASDQHAGNSELFLAEALTFFGAPVKEGESAVDKARRLASLIGAKRALLILDGLEPLQHAPSWSPPGELKDEAMRALLKGLAESGKGLTIVTTRCAIPDLANFGALVRQQDLSSLSKEAGAHLLQTLGVIGSQAEREALSRVVNGHALTLTILGGYLYDVHGGDIAKRDLVKLSEADAKQKGGHAFRAMAAYAEWFNENENGRRALSMLALMGLFDRPADAGCLEALWRAPAIPGVTDALVDLGESARNNVLIWLSDASLVTVERDANGALVSLDAHPLLREYFAKELRENNPDGWKAAHKRLYEHLCATETDKKPAPTLDDLRPLYQAVAHGCHAGVQQEACDEVYLDRILRGGEHYTWHKLGVFGAELGALACFFDAPWTTLSPHLSPPAQAWLLNEAAYCLRALGRLQEALEPMRAALKMGVEQQNWESAAIRASNISQLALTLGDVAAAVQDGAASVAHADRSGNAFMRIVNRTTHADALHQQGAATARALFETAEEMQKEMQPDYPLLYSLPGFRYCDLLLAPTERAAWRVLLAAGVGDERRARDGAGAFPLPHPEERETARVSKDEGEEKPAERPSSSFETRRMRVAPQDEGFETPAPQAPQDEDVLRSMDRASPDARTTPPSLRGGEADESIQSRTRDSGWIRFARNDDREALRADCDAVARRGEKMFEWRVPSDSRLDIALDHLTLARAALYATILRGRAPDGANPDLPDGAHLDTAVNGLRDSGYKDEQPRGLLTRALYRAVTGDFPGARDDLDEAFDIAERGPMRLHLADIHLHRARLFGLLANRPADYPWLSPADDLAKARALIEDCDYGRRKEELEDAEAALSLLP